MARAISPASPDLVAGAASVTQCTGDRSFVLAGPVRRVAINIISSIPVSADSASLPSACPAATATAAMPVKSRSIMHLVAAQLSANVAVSGRTNPIRPPGRTFFRARARNDAPMPARALAGWFLISRPHRR